MRAAPKCGRRVTATHKVNNGGESEGMPPQKKCAARGAPLRAAGGDSNRPRSEP